MPTGHLRDVFEAVATKLGTLKSKIGKAALYEHDSAPLVVWVPGRELRKTGPASYQNRKADPKLLRLRLCSVDAHIWGKDDRDAESRSAEVEVALHLAGIEFGFEQDVIGSDPEDADGAIAIEGIGTVLHVEIWIPITLEGSIRVKPLTPNIVREIVEQVTGHITTEP